MSHSYRSKKPMYVYDLPYDVLRKLFETLDINKGWQKLAGECGFTYSQVKQFELEYMRPNSSPTNMLFLDWGSRNPTIEDLYCKLRNINHLREMKLLEPILRANSQITEDVPVSGGPVKWIEEKGVQYSARPSPNTSFSTNLNTQDLHLISASSVHGAESQMSQSNNNTLQFTEDINLDQRHIGAAGGGASGGVTRPGIDHVRQPMSKRLMDNKMFGGYETKMYDKVIPGQTSELTNDFTQNFSKSVCTESLATLGSKHKLYSHTSGTVMLGESASSSKGGDADTSMFSLATPMFTHKELSCATNGFSSDNQIGEGAFGDVYRGFLKNTKCAIKKLKQTEKQKPGESNMQSAEVTMLLKYRHENIVQFYGYSIDDDEICLVYQYLSRGSLEDRLQCKGNSAALTWTQRINILRGSACGLQYLHTAEKQPLVHGDIKSANVLLDHHFEPKVADFGLAKHANAGPQTGVFTHVKKTDVSAKIYGTRAYLPPEFLTSGGEASTKSDTFGFGVVIVETCSGEKAYDERREPEKFLVEYVYGIFEQGEESGWIKQLQDPSAPPCPQDVLIKLLKLGRKCISERKKHRPDMTEVLMKLEEIFEVWNVNYLMGFEGPQLTLSQQSVSSTEDNSYNSPTSASNYSATSSLLSYRSFDDVDTTDASDGSHYTDVCATSPGYVETLDNQDNVGTCPGIDRDRNNSLRPIARKQQSSDGDHSFSSQTSIEQNLKYMEENDMPVPEALRLQQCYDARMTESSIISLTAGEPSHKNNVSVSDDQEFASDPKKLREIEEHESSLFQSPSPLEQLQTNSVIDGSSSSCNTIYQADEKKMEAIAKFDRENLVQGEITPTNTSQLVSDPAKLEYIAKFDAGITTPVSHSIVQSPRLQPDGTCNVLQYSGYNERGNDPSEHSTTDPCARLNLHHDVSLYERNVAISLGTQLEQNSKIAEKLDSFSVENFTGPDLNLVAYDELCVLGIEKADANPLMDRYESVSSQPEHSQDRKKRMLDFFVSYQAVSMGMNEASENCNPPGYYYSLPGQELSAKLLPSTEADTQYYSNDRAMSAVEGQNVYFPMSDNSLVQCSDGVLYYPEQQDANYFYSNPYTAYGEQTDETECNTEARTEIDPRFETDDSSELAKSQMLTTRVPGVNEKGTYDDAGNFDLRSLQDQLEQMHHSLANSSG